MVDGEALSVHLHGGHEGGAGDVLEPIHQGGGVSLRGLSHCRRVLGCVFWRRMRR